VQSPVPGYRRGLFKTLDAANRWAPLDEPVSGDLVEIVLWVHAQRNITGLALRPGDEIRIEGVAAGGENACIDYVETDAGRN